MEKGGGDGESHGFEFSVPDAPLKFVSVVAPTTGCGRFLADSVYHPYAATSAAPPNSNTLTVALNGCLDADL